MNLCAVLDVLLAAGPLTSWLRWPDVLLDRFPQTERIAQGFSVIAAKGGQVS